MKLDHLFQRNDVGMSRRNRQEPRFARGGRSLVPVDRDPLDGSDLDQEPDKETAQTRHVGFSIAPRNMSPRQLAVWAHDMYLCNAFTWEEYRLAGFPAEMHPDYNRTVGALTGRNAQPESPRDMVEEWEERLAFALRHNDPSDAEVRRTEKVLRLLRRQDLTRKR